MSKIYKAVVVGMGKRGMHHASAFAKNPRFELAGISDLDEGRLAKARATTFRTCVPLGRRRLSSRQEASCA